MTAYYNEIDPYAAQWLRNLIAGGHIAPGEVDERSIVDVSPDDLAGYDQCHFFAGIGGWRLAARLAGWPDDRPLWTGSCPCQPFSVAGKGGGQEDERHLWPIFFSLISARRPHVVMGEQVAAAVGKDWLDGVHSDLESIGYACGAAVVPACAVDAPHKRDRLWFVADASRERRDWQFGAGDQSQIASGRLCDAGDVDDPFGARLERQRGDDRYQPGRVDTDTFGSAPAAGSALPAPVADADEPSKSEEWEQRSGELGGPRSNPSHSSVGNANVPRTDAHPETGASRRATGKPSSWSSAEWLEGADGKARRVEPGIRLLAHGVPARVGKLRALGNAIVPQVAAEVIAAFMDTQPPHNPTEDSADE